MVGFPAVVEDVGEGEVAVAGGGGGEGLPDIELVARAGEHHNAVDLDVLGHSGGGGGTVGDAAEDDLVPNQVAAAGGDELLPVALRVLTVEPLHELQRAAHDAIGFGNADRLAEVLAGGGFEADFRQEEIVLRRRAAVELAEPAVGVVDLDGVVAVAGDAFEESRVVAHQPDHQLAGGWHAGVDAGMLKILRLGIGAEDEADLRVLLRLAVDLAGAGLEVVALRGGVGFRRGEGGGC